MRWKLGAAQRQVRHSVLIHNQFPESWLEDTVLDRVGWTTEMIQSNPTNALNNVPIRALFRIANNVAVFIDPWKTAYHLEAEHTITRNNLLATIPLLKKEWKVSFDFKANNKFKGLQQIFHMTVGGKGAGSGAKHGDRPPAVWTHSSKGFLISSSVGGKYSFSKYFKLLPSSGEWINIEVVQQLEASHMIYTIQIGGEQVFSTRNAKPLVFENVKVFASSSWFSPVSGSIKNLLIQNKNDGGSI